MSEYRTTDQHLDEQTPVKPKVRECLRCQTKFESQWAGERICGRCKGSTAWRTGAPIHSPPTKR